MEKYLGTYRVLIERDENGEPLEFTYLTGTGAYKNCKIYRYGHNTLALYVSGGSATLYKNTESRFTENEIEIINLSTAEREAVFVFHEKDLKIVAGFINVKTSGASIRPNSIKNHPKYKEIKEQKKNNRTPEEEEKLRKRMESLRSKLEVK